MNTTLAIVLGCVLVCCCVLVVANFARKRRNR